ncbi:MAG: hypothetical protein WC797_02630 [Candidatus Paceibacterota bacterium]
MTGFQGRSIYRRVANSTLSIVVLVVLAVLVSRSLWDIYLKSRVSGEKQAETEKKLNDLLARKAELEYDIGRLSTPLGVEQELRSKYNVVKPGEEAIVIDNKSLKVEAGISNDEGIWDRFVNWLGL